MTVNNSPFQDYPHPDDHTTQSTVTPGFKPFTVKQQEVYGVWSLECTKTEDFLHMFHTVYGNIKSNGRQGGLAVSTLDSGSKGPSSSSARGHFVFIT